MTVSLKYCD